MNTWLKNYFQSDDLPPTDVLISTYKAARRVVTNREVFPLGNHRLLSRLIEEMEADPEICNILAENGV